MEKFTTTRTSFSFFVCGLAWRANKWCGVIRVRQTKLVSRFCCRWTTATLPTRELRRWYYNEGWHWFPLKKWVGGWGGNIHAFSGGLSANEWKYLNERDHTIYTAIQLRHTDVNKAWYHSQHPQVLHSNKVNTLRASPQSLSWLEIIAARNTCSTTNIFNGCRVIY